MTSQTSTAPAVVAPQGSQENYGLHTGVLGPLETLAQSVSAIAPSTSPSLLIPVTFALAGNATWFIYLLATGATLLVGFCVSRFARLSASPGSLYSFTANTLSPLFGNTAAWGLLMAYVASGASAAGEPFTSPTPSQSSSFTLRCRCFPSWPQSALWPPLWPTATSNFPPS